MIDEAVSFGSFDNLRQLESKGFFRQGGMKLRNPDDPNSFKVRRGKVGGYRDYFTAEQAAELEALVQERLSPAFGYTPVREPEPVSASRIRRTCSMRLVGRSLRSDSWSASGPWVGIVGSNGPRRFSS